MRGIERQLTLPVPAFGSSASVTGPSAPGVAERFRPSWQSALASVAPAPDLVTPAPGIVSPALPKAPWVWLRATPLRPLPPNPVAEGISIEQQAPADKAQSLDSVRARTHKAHAPSIRKPQDSQATGVIPAVIPAIVLAQNNAHVANQGTPVSDGAPLPRIAPRVSVLHPVTAPVAAASDATSVVPLSEPTHTGVPNLPALTECHTTPQFTLQGAVPHIPSVDGGPPETLSSASSPLLPNSSKAGGPAPATLLVPAVRSEQSVPRRSSTAGLPIEVPAGAPVQVQDSIQRQDPIRDSDPIRASIELPAQVSDAAPQATHLSPPTAIVSGDATAFGAMSGVGARSYFGSATPVVSSSPRQIEVGILDGTHGWLHVRAALSSDGTVGASLLATSTAHDSIRESLPAMASYLRAESVQVDSIVVHRLAEGSSPTSLDCGFNSGGGNSGTSSGQGPHERSSWEGHLAGGAPSQQQGGNEPRGPTVVAQTVAPIVSHSAYPVDLSSTVRDRLGFGGSRFSNSGSFFFGQGRGTWLNVQA
jgi:hypothetical protein